MRQFIALAAAALTALPGIAAAAEPPCLTPAEFTALSSYALPSIITGTTQRCAATLPADAWLRRNGGQLAARYAAAKPAAWPGAKAAFLKLSAGQATATPPICSRHARCLAAADGRCADRRHGRPAAPRRALRHRSTGWSACSRRCRRKTPPN